MDNNSLNGKRVRASTIEGIFYPREKAKLKTRVGKLLNHGRSRPKPGAAAPAGGTPYCIVAPHAALDYSGAVAAAAFKTVSGRKVSTAVVLGPVHREAVDRIILPHSELFQTPLGTVEVAAELLERLAAFSPRFLVDDIPHLEEHCLEAQLPFIQHLFPEAAIVPILLGNTTLTLVEQLADALWQLLAARLDSTLIVVSANMSAYKRLEQGEAELARLLALIRQGEWRTLVAEAQAKRISSCGAGCLAAILLMHSRLAGSIEILKQGSSLDMVKDPKKVVHYLAIAFRQEGTKKDGVPADRS